MSKVRKEGLDYGSHIRETTGDMLMEGRHGNSLRIGSRSNNPYVFISNKRNSTNNIESLGDGSLISITSNGSLRQHFDNLFDDKKNGEPIEFKYDSDKLTTTVNRMGDVWSDVNGGIESNELYLYGLMMEEKEITNEDGTTSVLNVEKGIPANQILFHSDRISLNTKLV